MAVPRAWQWRCRVPGNGYATVPGNGGAACPAMAMPQCLATAVPRARQWLCHSALQRRCRVPGNGYATVPGNGGAACTQCTWVRDAVGTPCKTILLQRVSPLATARPHPTREGARTWQWRCPYQATAVPVPGNGGART
ncbi:mucin-associated surface protein [Lasius niger]|uniref:Mucin-associated surface protein n=1 Tax=Lasius niger TaxID=67767 RepID=A0A0J7JZL5_LASNI|nr:mucin-associated surface protein [Lasius niger]